MARRTVQVTSQENGSSGDAHSQELLAGVVPILEPVISTGLVLVGCPVSKCAGLLRGDASGYDSRMGLEPMVCTLCGHRGFRSREGVLLLFRGGYEFKFSYGPSIHTITIVLSSAAVNLWGTHDVTDDQLAKIAAEWALLCGHTSKQVHLGIPADEFADFYLYFCKQ